MYSTVNLPLALPAAPDEDKFFVTDLVIGNAPAIGVPNFIPGSLTATSFDIDIFDGSSFGSALPCYLMCTWVS